MFSVHGHGGAAHSLPLAVNITMQSIADAPAFNASVGYQLRDAPKTQSSVEWPLDPDITPLEEVMTPSFSSLLQEVIDMDGWESGNAISIVLQPLPGRSSSTAEREWNSFDQTSRSERPLLTVETCNAPGLLLASPSTRVPST